MGARGRKTVADKVVQIRALEEMQAPPPPRGLSKAASLEWTEIVASKPADWFSRATWPMLEAYCRHTAEMRRIAADLDKLVEQPDYSRREYRDQLRAMTDQSKAVASFGVRLGIARTSMTGRHNNDPDTVAETDLPWKD
jgi:phage terminase small subunit